MVGEAGVDVAVDFVGKASTFELGRSLLGVGGRFVAVAPGTESISVAANDLIDGGKSYLGTYDSTVEDLVQVLSWLEAGQLKPIVTRRAPLEEAAQVLHDLRGGKIVGRAVLLPGSDES